MSRDKVMLITGGARGLGLGCVQACLARGWAVVAADLSQEGDLPEGAMFLQCDVTVAAAVKDMVAEVVQRFGGLDGVVANAGVPDWEPFLELSTETYQRVMRVNVEGVFRTAQEAGRQMAEQGHGAMVLMSSVRAVASNPLHAAYTASKGAVNALVTALATELGPMGIRVNGVLPGACDTPMQEAAADKFFDGDAHALAEQMARSIPLGRLGRASEVGSVAAFLLSDEASYVHGALIPVDGGLLSSLT